MDEKIKASYGQASGLVRAVVEKAAKDVLDCISQPGMSTKEMIGTITNNLANVILDRLDVPDVKEEIKELVEQWW